MRAVGLLLCVAVAPPLSAATAQQISPYVAAERAESLRLAGRPWHAAETLLAAAAREPRLNATFIVEGAKAELHARRYDRARSLLVGQPWLEDYSDGAALAVLAEAEARLGLGMQAAGHYAAARARARGARAALLAVREGLAWEAGGARDSAAAAYGAARAAGLPAIDAWLRLRQARVTRDTAVAFRLLADLPAPAAREAGSARAQALLAAGDSAAALDAFAQAGRSLDLARLALAHGDSSRARDALYGLMARAPESDDAAAAVGVALDALRPRTPPERVALARAMKGHGGATDARIEVERALRQGDSSAATLVLAGELFAAAGRFRDAERAYRFATADPTLGALAIYRRARVLVRLGDAGAREALSGFAQSFPSDTAAPTALYMLGDMLADRGDWSGAARWFGELIARYPADLRASLARFRLAAQALRDSLRDSAAALFQAEVAAAGPQRTTARFWLGKLTLLARDTAGARATWLALVREDSIGYYGLRARREVDLPPLRIAAAPLPGPSPVVATSLGRIDTLLLAGLDTAAQAEVRALLGRAPQQDVDALLAWSDGLAARGFGPAAVRLGWQAALKSPNDSRVLRVIFPWPNRRAVEAEAAEFGIDPLLLVAIVRQESVFDAQALSPAGARGLAQLLPGTAALTARGLDVTFYPEWITVPDLNLHLGAAHLQELLQRFGGRVDAAAAAYNAGGAPVKRWLERPGADDPDEFIELIPYQETRGYVRAVLRNRELYRALYVTPTN
ncbi:MAG TPA: transglycosylase SLT domain-containing protein [Gemmatimonadales bacterium]|nr:transglycosylase SLT domain-containing protein [Gemmatimonadales bacterium]